MSGYISGVIRNARNNDSLEGVLVNIFQGIMDTQITDSNGEFTSIELEPGIYFVQAALEGYQTSPRLAVRVNEDSTTNIDIGLSELETVARYYGDRDEKTILQTDQSGNLNVRSEAGQFDELINNEKTPIIELDCPYGLSNLRDITIEENGASVSNNGVEFILETTAQTESRAVLDSAERGRYQPGNAGEMGIAVRLPVDPVGTQVARWGYFDDQNGAFFGIDNNGIFVNIRRAGLDTKTYRNDWNGDSLDGSGPSGLSLNLSRGNIFQILYTCYGYGVTNFRVLMVDDNDVQRTVTVHRYKPDAQTTFGDPNLPIRGEILNGEETAAPYTMFVAGRQYHVVGRYVPNRRITSERNLELSVNTTLSPAISFKRKEDFPIIGRSNSVSVKLQSFDIISDSDLIYEILFAPVLQGANFDTPTGTSPDETAVESDVTATGFDNNQRGDLIFSGLVSGDSQGPFASTQFSSVELLDIDFSGLKPVTLAVRTISGSGIVNIVFRVREEW
ncbi:carboxypeptidase-like regulatory domain-containing protein [Natronospora cellulosivora (SeqCode)]